MNWEINFCFRYLHFSGLFQTGRWRGFFQATKKYIDDLKLFCEKSKSENTARKYK